jgi:hypothetical protein
MAAITADSDDAGARRSGVLAVARYAVDERADGASSALIALLRAPDYAGDAEVQQWGLQTMQWLADENEDWARKLIAGGASHSRGDYARPCVGR